MEKQEIMNLIIDQYIKGTFCGDCETVQSAFSDDAQMNGFFGARYGSMSAAAYAAGISEGPSMREQGIEYHAEIEEIRLLSDRTATALIRERNFHGTDFLTAFHLVKHPENGWKIVSKLFTNI